MALISNGTTVASGGKVQGSGESLTRGPVIAADAIGTTALIANSSWTAKNAGDSISGNLYYSACNGTYNGSVGGTWRVMGHMSGNSHQNRNTTVMLRIS